VVERSKLKEYATEILTEEERVEYAGPLQSMEQSLGWPLYVELLTRMRQSARESFESVTKLEDMRFQQGLIAGLKLAQDSISLVIQQAEETMLKEEARGRFRAPEWAGEEADPSF
jgi:hypothetical protein